MPRTKKQEIIYTIMMVIVMVYGMVCYNIALDTKGMQYFIFGAALSELPLMGVVAFVLDTFIAGPIAKKITFRLFTPGQDKQIFIILSISLLSLWTMCPMMSLAATIFFKTGVSAQILPVWLGTTALNMPAALICRSACKIYFRKSGDELINKNEICAISILYSRLVKI